MTDSTTNLPSEVSRREMLRRSAALSAAVIAATPTVQAIGRIPAFAVVTPVNGDNDILVPSHIQLLLRFPGDNNTVRGAKWDQGWEGLFQQGNVCWDPMTADYQKATSAQVAQLQSSVPVTPTASGFRVDFSDFAGLVVDGAATFDGSNCFYLSEGDGPYWDGDVLVFPKPGSGQGGGGGAGTT